MKLLAIDTSSSACSIALLWGETVTASHVLAPMQQTQLILPMIEKMMQEVGAMFHELDALAWGSGPGSFTGVRVAASVVQGLGYAFNLPIISVSSLAALAQASYEDLGWKQLLVGVDARLQEIYWGAYQVNEEGWVELVGQEMVSLPDRVVVPAGEHWYGVGDAWSIYRDQIGVNVIETAPSCLPTAKGVLQLAQSKFRTGDYLQADYVLPTYLRDQVAQKS